MNIILLFADDQGPHLTGFEGNAEIRTPHLDRLAAESTCFGRCFTPTPLDAASQATVLTGQYPHLHRVTGNEGHLRPDTETFTSRLWRAGYACGIVGNLRLPDDEASDPGFGLTDFVAADDGTWMNARTWVNGEEGQARAYLLDWQADQAIRFIDQYQDQAFFLWVCFRAPREPWEYPPGTEKLYPPASLEIPKTSQIDTALRPQRLNSDVLATQYTVHQARLAEIRSKYYAMITRMDENIGRILDRLKTGGLSEKTLVVFACGNGLALGDHKLFGKGPAFYDEFVRGPLLIRDPMSKARGARLDAVVGLVDLAPTLLEGVGLSPPMTMQGRSLLALLRGGEPPGSVGEAFIEYEPPAGPGRPPGAVRGIVTAQYKFIDYLDGSSSLFDLKRDPLEMEDIGAILNNRTSHPRFADYTRNYGSVQRVFRDRLTQWRRLTKDPTLK